jgi:hypothetical protein
MAPLNIKEINVVTSVPPARGGVAGDYHIETQKIIDEMRRVPPGQYLQVKFATRKAAMLRLGSIKLLRKKGTLHLGDICVRGDTLYVQAPKGSKTLWKANDKE